MGTTKALRTTMLALSLALAIAVTSAGADDLLVEGEEFESYGSNDLGGVAIGTEWCSGASGFQAAGGLDIPGEWILLKVTFSVEACYASQIAYQSGYGDSVKLRVRMVDAPEPGQELWSEYLLTEGWGFG